MQLQLQSFQTLVSNAAAAVQGAASQLLDLTVGSTLRAILEANASLALWLQWLILQVLSVTRAATSSGADLDSWMADFTLTRLPASQAAGQVSFSRFTPSQASLIPAGTQVRTADGSQSFLVTADAANPAWNGPQNGYLLGQGLASLTVPLQAAIPGAAGNVQAEAITLIATAIAGIDSVTNPASLSGGLDAETDAALRTRFAAFLASRSRATRLSIGQAILSTRQGLSYTLQENMAPDGSARPGSFVVTVDDGSGTPSTALLSNVAASVDAVRPIGSLFAVQGPSLVQANVSLAIITQAGVSHTTVTAACVTAITAAINTLPIGAPLPLTRLAQLAYAADPSITNVAAILLNGTTSDLAPGPAGLIKAGIIQVN
jgi:uncharacterized phage protein gp47/JayE